MPVVPPDHPHWQAAAGYGLQNVKMGSVLTIDTSCDSALRLGDAAPAANSIRGSYLSLTTRPDRREEIFRDDVHRKRFLEAMEVIRRASFTAEALGEDVAWGEAWESLWDLE